MALGFTLGACGSQFVAEGDGAAGSAGLSTAGKTAAGGTAQGGNPSAGQTSSGGTAGRAGETGVGGTTGGVAGGAGAAGMGGGVVVPPLPEIPRLGLAVWLSADVGVQQKDGIVERWIDQSGNKMDATQGPGESRPSFDVRGFNDRPAIVFDGKFDYLEFAPAFGSFKLGVTAFIVGQPVEATSECWSTLEFSNGSEIDDISFGMWQGKWLYEVEVPYLQKGTVQAGHPAVMSVLQRVDGTTDLRVNGALVGADKVALPKEIQRNDNFIGRTLYQSCTLYTGSIAEIILYSRALGSGEVQAVESYLNQHWALAPTPAR